MSPLTLIVRNLKNKRYQYIIIGILFFILNMCILSTVYLTKGLSVGVEVAKDKLGADIILTSKYNDQTIESIYNGVPTSSKLTVDYESLKALNGVEKCCKRLFLATLEGASCCDNKIQLIAVDKDDYLLQALATKPVDPGHIIIGNNVNGEIGQTVRYYGKDFTVSEVLAKTGTGYDYSGFITYDDANAIIRDNSDKLSEYEANDISAVFISSDNPTLTRNIINNRFSKDVSAYLTDNKIAEYAKTVSSVKTTTVLMTTFLVISSILSIVTIMTLMFLSRKNEVGILILSGFKKRAIHNLFLSEAVITIFVSTFLSFVFFNILFEMNKVRLESIFHCPLGSVNGSWVILTLFLCSIVFVNVIICFILNTFCKKDACTLLKEVN